MRTCSLSFGMPVKSGVGGFGGGRFFCWKVSARTAASLQYVLAVVRVSSSAMVCFRGWCWPGDDASTASGAAFAGAMSVGLCLRWGSRGAVVTTAGRAASSMQVAPFRCVCVCLVCGWRAPETQQASAALK